MSNFTATEDIQNDFLSRFEDYTGTPFPQDLLQDLLSCTRASEILEPFLTLLVRNFVEFALEHTDDEMWVQKRVTNIINNVRKENL